MLVSITESDGTKRVMQGAIKSINIDVENKTLIMEVIGLKSNFIYTIKGNVYVTESEVL